MSTGLTTLITLMLILLVAGLLTEAITDIRNKKGKSDDKVYVKCRHGVEYSTRVAGTWGEISRTEKMLANCCCYVCYNHDCKQAVLGKQQCHEECRLFVKEPYCATTCARVK